MDRNRLFASSGVDFAVALRKESVDRNAHNAQAMKGGIIVALRKESVDRNNGFICFIRSWPVALRKESVDRNTAAQSTNVNDRVALRKESVDRNIQRSTWDNSAARSLSARRAWIEIIDDLEPSNTRKVALRKESVDRNASWKLLATLIPGRSPQGERG